MERLSEQGEQHRRMLLWLAERIAEPAQVPCADCGHSVEHHAGEGGSLCMFPATIGAPASICRCAGFQP